MKKADSNRLELRAKIVKSLAHPTRLMIVEELQNGEKCVCELAVMANVDMSTISRHLSSLKNAGVLSDEKRGTSVYYKLQCNCIPRFLSCIEAVIKSNTKRNT
jgi:ArsR family transcriptional regulator, arsenate/arsenite/antimonite-responsive transcriptional repressor